MFRLSLMTLLLSSVIPATLVAQSIEGTFLQVFRNDDWVEVSAEEGLTRGEIVRIGFRYIPPEGVNEERLVSEHRVNPRVRQSGIVERIRQPEIIDGVRISYVRYKIPGDAGDRLAYVGRLFRGKHRLLATFRAKIPIVGPEVPREPFIDDIWIAPPVGGDINQRLTGPFTPGTPVRIVTRYYLDKRLKGRFVKRTDQPKSLARISWEMEGLGYPGVRYPQDSRNWVFQKAGVGFHTSWRQIVIPAIPVAGVTEDEIPEEATLKVTVAQADEPSYAATAELPIQIAPATSSDTWQELSSPPGLFFSRRNTERFMPSYRKSFIRNRRRLRSDRLLRGDKDAYFYIVWNYNEEPLAGDMIAEVNFSIPALGIAEVREAAWRIRNGYSVFKVSIPPVCDKKFENYEMSAEVTFPGNSESFTQTVNGVFSVLKSPKRVCARAEREESVEEG